MKGVVDLTPLARPVPLGENEREQAIDELLKFLLRERGLIAAFSASYARKRELVRRYMNERPPLPVPQEILSLQDRLFWTESLERGIVDVGEFSYSEHGIALYEGDICRLNADAIVNAANKGLLGCFLPGHNCIDNVIHSYAGMQVRGDCAALIAAQGREEEAGSAKLTRAYNLPSRYILHTVGPMVGREVTERDRAALRAAYLSCLDLASEAGIESVAFCCLSTGVFNFPRAEAAEIASGAVLGWKLRHPQCELRIIFNTYLKEDTNIYRNILDMMDA